MVNRNTKKNVNKVLFEIEKFFFATSNNYSNIEILERWNTYTDIIGQLKHLNKQHYLFEIYYRILIGDNMNQIFIDIIDTDSEIYSLLFHYTYILEEFQDFDEIIIFV